MIYLYLFLIVHLYFDYKFTMTNKKDLGIMLQEAKQIYTKGTLELAWLETKHLAKVVFKYYLFSPYYYLSWFVLRVWTQDLRDNKRDKENYFYNKRGSLAFKDNFKDEIMSWQICFRKIPEYLGFKLTPELHYGKFQLDLYFIWFSAYLTLPFFRIKGSVRREIQLEYFFEDTTLWVRWKKGGDEWGDGSKGVFKIIHILDYILGKPIHFTKEMTMFSFENYWFEFRGKEYKATQISAEVVEVFRSRIPFGLWHKTSHRYEIKVDNPPKYAGKGENSWDCDDNATYAISGGLTKEEMAQFKSYNTRDKFAELVIGKYCESTRKNIKRYGRASDDTYEQNNSEPYWKVIGYKPKLSTQDHAETFAGMGEFATKDAHHIN